MAPRQGEEEDVQHIFVYGNLRPDVRGIDNVRISSSRKAWLLGGRLYMNRNRAAVKLEEPGNAVRGFVVSSESNFVDLVKKCEDLEHMGYERDVVEVITECGQRVPAYVFHCEQVDRSIPIRNGDWTTHLN